MAATGGNEERAAGQGGREAGGDWRGACTYTWSAFFIYFFFFKLGAGEVEHQS